MSGAPLTHVGFKSSSENAMALLGGQTTATVDASGSLLPHIEAGKVRVLMSFDEKPAAWMPGVPTARSLGYDLAYPAPYGIVGPANLPAPVVAKLNAAFKAAIDDPEYAKLLETLRQTYWYKGPGEYGKWAAEFYRSERSLVERAKLLRQP
jgi:tripartite-type tricarboxylate transporter receptor subunit TctC